jgi:hypothetical protein
MPDRAQMHANLVGAAGVDGHPHQRDAAQLAGAVTMRVTASRARRARVDIFWRCTSDRGRWASIRRPASHDPPTPARRTPSRLSRSWNCRDSSRCAASFLATTITPDVPRSSRCTMPGTQSSPPMPLRSFDVVQQRVHERAVTVARAGMHDQAGGLVHHDQIGILVAGCRGGSGYPVSSWPARGDRAGMVDEISISGRAWRLARERFGRLGDLEMPLRHRDAGPRRSAAESASARMSRGSRAAR